MTAATRSRGRLPQRVYWFRRVLVLTVAAALVFGIGRVLEAGPGSGDGPSARPASAQGSGVTPPAPTSLATAEVNPARQGRRKAGEPRRSRTALAMPTGPCRASDVRVAPLLRETAYAGGDVRLTLRLTTLESPACTWQVGPGAVAVRLISGSDRIWSSQDCPSAVPTVPVVLRSGKAAFVEVTWPGRRSNSDCSRMTDWAVPGWYHVSAAALGSDPVTEQFELKAPIPETITPTPTPRPRKKSRG